MAYAPYPPVQEKTDFRKEIPHLIVLVILVVVLLFTATKFKWVHCSQVPGWCSAYCSLSGNSKVAIITNSSTDNATAAGNPQALSNILQNTRPSTIVATFPHSELSIGLVKSYDLIVLDGFKDITVGEADAVKQYIAQGGSVLWIADAASRRVLSEGDLADALQKNLTRPYYYENLLNTTNKTLGFGDDLSRLLRVSYLSTQPAASVDLKLVARDHLIASGVRPLQTLPPVPYTIVDDLAGATKIAVFQIGGKEYPAIMESRMGGSLVYVAFPLELSVLQDGTGGTLLNNIFDYLVSC